MKKLLLKYGNLLTAFAFIMASYGANRNCVYILHQPKLPESAKKLRKF